MSKEQTFRSEVYAKDNGFVVERYHPNGKMVDRYYTNDLTLVRKHKDWSVDIAAIASQPGACLPVEQTLSAKLAKLDAYLEKELQQAMQEAHNAEFKSIAFGAGNKDEDFCGQRYDCQQKDLAERYEL